MQIFQMEGLPPKKLDDAAPKPSFKHWLQAWCLHALTMSAVVQARVADSR
jgi:hypothetical protein